MLAILTTHPIQYQTPIWRGLAAQGDVPFQVLFMSDQGLNARFDPGFGRNVAWDIDLLEGYAHQFLPVETGPRQGAFGWLKLMPGFGQMLKSRGVKALWVQGWQVRAYWQAIFGAHKAGIQVWLRGESNLHRNRSGLKQSLKWFLLKRLLNKVDFFLTIGSANEAFYARLRCDPRRMIRTPYCVENHRFQTQAETLRSRRAQIRGQWGIPIDAFCFLWVGKFIAKKRPLDVVAALIALQKAQPNRKMHMLWVGTGELNGVLRRSCGVRFDDNSGLHEVQGTGKPVASFAGFLNQSEVALAYAAADALILSSDAGETWGLVANEAMASGLPCVVSAACGCADDLVLPHFPELCYPMGDTKALAVAMSAVMANTPTAGQVQEIIAAYDIGRTVESVSALYRQQFGARRLRHTGEARN